MTPALLDFALARMGFLRATEAERLRDLLSGDAEALPRLSALDFQYAIGRAIPRLVWRPEEYLAAAHADAAAAERFSLDAVPYWSAGYPPILREIPDPPMLLWVRGSLPDPTLPAVALVGTRFPSAAAFVQARRLGSEFAAAGVPVISGLARGTDAAAQEGCAASGGRTYAVLGSGCDAVYPVRNSSLAARIVDCGGGLISEYPPGDGPQKWHFPARNRIIAGLARAVVVVEAPERSGALITADFALQDGRDLYVGSQGLGSARGAGTRRLAADGAPVLDSATALLEDWGYPSTGLHDSEGVSDYPSAPLGNPAGVDGRSGPEAAGRPGASRGAGSGAASFPAGPAGADRCTGPAAPRWMGAAGASIAPSLPWGEDVRSTEEVYRAVAG